MESVGFPMGRQGKEMTTKNNDKFKYVSYGMYRKGGKWKLGIIPDEIVRQDKTPQWVVDQINEQIWGKA